MDGILKIYKNTDTLQDWQQRGHGYNPCFGINYSPTLELLPFWLNTDKSLTVSEFKIRKINTTDPTIKLIETTISLDTAWLVKTAGTFRDWWIFEANNEVSTVTKGYWEFYIKFSDGTEYISELFAVPEDADIISVLPDFNQDFNQDFLI
jgi:hypothetical protein